MACFGPLCSFFRFLFLWFFLFFCFLLVLPLSVFVYSGVCLCLSMFFSSLYLFFVCSFVFYVFIPLLFFFVRVLSRVLFPPLFLPPYLPLFASSFSPLFSVLSPNSSLFLFVFYPLPPVFLSSSYVLLCFFRFFPCSSVLLLLRMKMMESIQINKTSCFFSYSS
jgi:hypothetical protein